MARALGIVALGLVGFWLVAHLLWMGPLETAAQTTAMWALGLLTGGVGVAAAVLGCALIVVGLVHYRNTEPSGEIHRVVQGMVVLAARASSTGGSSGSSAERDRGAPRVPRGAPSIGGCGGHVGAPHVQKAPCRPAPAAKRAAPSRLSPESIVTLPSSNSRRSAASSVTPSLS